MSKIKISICASAIKPNFWMKSYSSLKANHLEWEMVYVGDIKPNFPLPPNFKWVYAIVKPAQCYEIAFRNATGELIMWTADDAHYEAGALDTAYQKYKENNEKTIVGLQTIEDGRDITNVHRLIGRNNNSPVMAPFGFMNRELFNKLGGYDRRFMCGQSENDVVMRVREIGGAVVYCDKKVFVDHDVVHFRGTLFRASSYGYYVHDRKILEGCWVKDNQIQNNRLCPVERYEDKDITTVTQSYKGKWK